MGSATITIPAKSTFYNSGAIQAVHGNMLIFADRMENVATAHIDVAGGTFGLGAKSVFIKSNTPDGQAITAAWIVVVSGNARDWFMSSLGSAFVIFPALRRARFGRPQSRVLGKRVNRHPHRRDHCGHSRGTGPSGPPPAMDSHNCSRVVAIFPTGPLVGDRAQRDKGNQQGEMVERRQFPHEVVAMRL